MLKRSKILILSYLVLVFAAVPAQAKLKIDIARSVQEVMGTINEYAKIAQEKMDEVMALQNRDILGDAKEAAMSINKVRDSVNKASAEMNKIRDEALGLQSDYDLIMGDVDDTVGNVGNVKDNIKDILKSDAEAYAHNTYKAMELQRERIRAESEFKKRYAAEEARYNGDIEKYDSNIQVYKEQLASTTNSEQRKELEKNIEDLELQKQLRTEAYEAEVAQIDADFDVFADEINIRINAVNELLVANLTKGENERAKSIFDEEGKTTADLLGEMANKVYIPKGKPENSKNIGLAQAAREVQAYKDNRNLIAQSIKLRLPVDDQRQYIEDLKDSVEIVDGSNSTVAINMELINTAIEAMLTNLKLELLSFKAEISHDLMSVSDYHMVDFADSDLGVLDFCNYKYKNPEKEKSVAEIKDDESASSGTLGVW